jgi:hypothetical protein
MKEIIKTFPAQQKLIDYVTYRSPKNNSKEPFRHEENNPREKD